MSFAALLLVSLGLSMDAFGASVSRGAFTGPHAPPPKFLTWSLVFGFFAALAPVLGWLLGRASYALIAAFDHWIAFVLLGGIGLKMVRDGMRRAAPTGPAHGYRLAVLLIAAIATSIDAASVGLTLPVFRVNIVLAASVIGLVTFLAAFAGTVTGRYAGEHVGRRAEIAGGVLLVAIAIRIVIEHTMLAPPVA